MSDIDEVDFMENQQQDSNSSQYTTKLPGTPPSLHKSSIMNFPRDNMERMHRRSVSEQIFSATNTHPISPRGHLRGHHWKITATDNSEGWDTYLANGQEGYGGGSLRGYSTGWDIGSRSGPAAYFSDFSPLERNDEALTHQQLSGGRSYTGGHFKQALKRTVKKALYSSRTDDEGNDGNSLSTSSTMALDSRHRYKKGSGDRKRHNRRPSLNADISDAKNKSDSDSSRDGPDSINMDSDGPVLDSQRKQSKIRSSLVDLFYRVKRGMLNQPSNENANQVIWNCTLTLRYAKLKEKANCCVHVFYMDKFITRSSFSGESNNPKWNENLIFPVSNIDGTLELQLIEKHSIRSDKLIGRAFISLQHSEGVCSHEASIKYFSMRKGSTQVLGTLRADTSIEPRSLNSYDDYSFIDTPEGYDQQEEKTSISTSDSFTRKHHLRKNLGKKLASRVYHHRLHRSKKNLKSPSSIETLKEPSIRSDGTFYFTPYEVTRRYLERNTVEPPHNFSWRPFFDWPGHRCREHPMMMVQHRYPVRFWELRIPKLPWPVEFLLPMTRLAFPTANLMDILNVGDTVKVTKIVESAVVNIFLVGGRGLRSMPQVDMSPGYRSEERGGMGWGGSGVGTSSAMGGYECNSSVSGVEAPVSPARGSNLTLTSPETRAASLVALHWAAKSLTSPPTAQVEFSYGNDKKSSNVVKNNYNPDFLEEFEFQVTNGYSRCITITVYDRETQSGAGGIPRSPILGETYIDLTDMPLELTQKMELQLVKNSNEARLLMFVTITGLVTTARSPVQTREHPSFDMSPLSELSTSRSMMSLPTYNPESEIQQRPSEQEEKSMYPNLPTNYLQLVAEHYGAKNSINNLQDIGWMRLKICSAMGLGGKATNGRAEIFCVVDMINTHLRTQNAIKQKSTTWDRCFVIPLTDIHGIMNITVIETEKSKIEILGGLAIHPLRIDNGASKWYALKTPDLRSATKGSILLEINVYFNQFKSALKTFSPMEVRYRSLVKKQMEFHKHELKMLQERFGHIRPLLELIRWCGRVLDDWWLWKKPLHSILGLIGYQLLVYYFKPYFIPLYMVLVLLKNRIYNPENAYTIIHGLKHTKTSAQLASPQEHRIYKHGYEILEQYMNQNALNRVRNWNQRQTGDEGNDMDLFDDSTVDNDGDDSKRHSGGRQDNDSKEMLNLATLALPELSIDQSQEDEERVVTPSKSEGKKTIRTRYADIKETITRIFDIVEKTASFYERVEGMFTWRIPWISSLAVIVLLILTFLLFFIPLKYIFMLWGLNKFTKAIIRPNAIRHNEILDFLSRVPNLIEAIELTEYRPDAFTIPTKGKIHKS